MNEKEPNNCPKCNCDLNGKDIYQHFLNEYTTNGNEYSNTIEQVLGSIKDYPELYKGAPSEAELRAMTEIELNAWYTASHYGWTKQNPQTFKKEIGIEIPGYYDGVVIWMCPECKHKWKRFDWVRDDLLLTNS